MKVLEYCCEPLEYGGEEMFMYNMYKNFSDENIQYTIATPRKLTNRFLIEEAKKRNENIIHLDLGPIRALFAMKKILKKEKFDVVHIHSSFNIMLYRAAKIAKKMGVPKVITHSHFALRNNKKMNLHERMYDLPLHLFKGYVNRRIEKYVDVFLGCSAAAIEFMYPERVFKSNNYTVIKNGIDIEKFEFNDKTRKEYRKKLNLSSKTLAICHVGRFGWIKNHSFIIDIAKELKDVGGGDFKLFLVGEGPEKQDAENKVKKLNLTDEVVFMGRREDVQNIMMACDVFILPSISEGFAVTSIEAQVSGLPTICSTAVTEETHITDLCQFLPIDDAKKWANAVAEKRNTTNRKKYAKIVAYQGFTSLASAKQLEKIFRA